MTILSIFYCALGGALGSGLRQFLSFFNKKKFPYGTFIANLSATVLLCLFIESDNQTFNLFFSIGFAASLSTFSTFAFEIEEMLEKKEFSKSLLYATSSVFLGIIFAQILI